MYIYRDKPPAKKISHIPVTDVDKGQILTL